MEGEIVPVIEGSPAQLSFWKLAYETHGSAVLSFLTSRLRRREEAEDLLQETFIRAIRAGESLRDAGRVRPYLMTIAHRLVLNEARRKKPVLISDASPDDAGTEWEIPDVAAESPEDAAHLSRVEDRLKGALKAMSADLGTAFDMAVLQQKSYAEIGESQGWNLNRVRINVYRARKKVIAALGDLIQEKRP